ncbi:MAG: hypothetical protein ACODAE_11600, partial [Gemmatimonadota bacterium]
MRQHDALDHILLTTVAAFGLVLAGCGAGAQDDDAADADAEADAAASEQATSDSLPAAIVGEAGPPTGEQVNYFTADPDTRGYLAVPE